MDDELKHFFTRATIIQKDVQEILAKHGKDVEIIVAEDDGTNRIRLLYRDDKVYAKTDVMGLVVVPWVYSPKKDIPKM
ncbi:hypothetical protein K4K53_002581 [Colletotrichum sp. SAR 10_77]|nr:hypothetical protein K4K53_002581 [Colletotrichum sp. SAR 10_77]